LSTYSDLPVSARLICLASNPQAQITLEIVAGAAEIHFHIDVAAADIRVYFSLVPLTDQRLLDYFLFRWRAHEKKDPIDSC
jgi:hypothetical protein